MDLLSIILIAGALSPLLGLKTKTSGGQDLKKLVMEAENKIGERTKSKT